jgi:hypothetical protein
MTTIKTAGNTDTRDLFAKSDVLTSSQLRHTPFIVFVHGLDGSIRVELVSSAKKLVGARYPSTTRVMVQWKGQYSSDFFQCTVGDVTAAWGQIHATP